MDLIVDFMDYTMDCLWTKVWTYGPHNMQFVDWLVDIMDYTMDCLWTYQWTCYGLIDGLFMDMVVGVHYCGLQMDLWMDVWTSGHTQIRYTP